MRRDLPQAAESTPGGLCPPDPPPAAIAVLALLLIAFATALAPAAEAKEPGKAPKGKHDDGPSAFDRGAAASALATVDLAKCKAPNAKRGDGHVTVTFATSGMVSSALVDKGPMAGTPVAKCISSQFQKVKVPAFRGDAVRCGEDVPLRVECGACRAGPCCRRS